MVDTREFFDTFSAMQHKDNQVSYLFLRIFFPVIICFLDTFSFKGLNSGKHLLMLINTFLLSYILLSFFHLLPCIFY